MNKQPSKIKNRTFLRAFSLLEVLIATILVGFALAALLGANGSFSMANSAGADLSTAEFLAEQIREMTTMLPVAEPDTVTWTALGPETGEAALADYDDVDDFDGFDSAAVGAPISAQGTPLTDLATFRQEVFVQKLNPTNFDETWADDSASEFVRVTVNVLEGGRLISSARWVRARY